MVAKSIKKNYLYNLCYQVLLVITPLVTTPYLSRVLGADGVGEVSFAESIISYFSLFAVLGISIYGQREVSYAQDNRSRRSQVFWETKLLETITSILVIVVYIPFALMQENRIMYLILSVNLFTVTIDVSWLLHGMEEFGKTTFRNMVFRMLNIIFIFLFVKSRDDVYIYVFITVLSNLLANLSMWSYVPKYVDKPIWKKARPFRNIRVVISLFIPTIAMQIYTVLDKTMIGVITNSPYENGYYEQSIKISRMVLTIVTALGTVMIPRIGFYHEKGEKETVSLLMYRGYRFVWFLGIPLCFGLIGISTNMVPWFFGPGFDKVSSLLIVHSFLIPAIGISNVTGMQYLIPTKRQKLFTSSVLIGAGINFLINCLLIPLFQSTGAAIASVIAETAISFSQIWLVRKELSPKRILFSSWHYILAGSVMLFSLLFIGKKMESSLINTFIMIAFGGFFYFSILVMLKDELLLGSIKSVSNRFFKR